MGGTVTVTPCTTSGDYSVSGCSAIICTDPGTAGYTMTNFELDRSATFNVTGTCSDGYEGTVTVTPCTTSGDYSVSGCSGKSSTADPSTTGGKSSTADPSTTGAAEKLSSAVQ